MPTDRLTDELRARYTDNELAALHQQLAELLDDDTPTTDPLGRLCDALHGAAYTQPATADQAA